MATTLYLIETRAQRNYVCPACQQGIPKGALHFRHDPHPRARIFRGEPTTHWCRECIRASLPHSMDGITRRLRVPAVRVMSHSSVPGELQLPLFNPLRIELVEIGRILSEQLSKESSLIYRISPEQFEEFLCDRLFAMGFEPRRVGAINQKDGGIDILFWPRLGGAFPFLGAAQVKHHRDPKTKEGPATVRDFAGVIASHSLNVGMLVTNTSFSPSGLLLGFATSSGSAQLVPRPIPQELRFGFTPVLSDPEMRV
jgi:hypothetical protein